MAFIIFGVDKMDKERIDKRSVRGVMKHPIGSFIALIVFCLIIIPTCILLAFAVGRQLNFYHMVT